MWTQHGRLLKLTCSLGRFWAEMPDGWRLADCRPAALDVAAWLLLHNIPAAADECLSREALLSLEPRPRPDAGRTLLCYSAGADSTAALMLLPEDTIPVYCRRPYESYQLRGRRIRLASFAPIERCLDAVGGVTQIPSTFETIGLFAGQTHGFRDGYGYGAMACLLADHFDASAVAFGSVLDNVFLGSGNNYTDIVACESSSWHFYRKLFAIAGLDFCLPTGCLSEVATERIVRSGPLADLAVSCPLADADGVPCGTCFKCFRKLRLIERLAKFAPGPSPGTLAKLIGRPLKQAVSTVYACRQADYWPAGLDEYRDVKLDFLARFHDYGLENLLPGPLSAYVRGRLSGLGVDRMDPEDDYLLRSIGRVFWPSAFSRTRAGLPVERLDSQSLA